MAEPIFNSGYAYFLSDNERQEIAKVAKFLPASLKRMSPDDYHMTLLKITLNTPAPKNEEFYAAHRSEYLDRLANVASKHEPFELHLDKIGVSKKAVFLYTNDSRIQIIRDELRTNLPIIEPYGFNPNFAHVTLARLSGDSDQQAIAQLASSMDVSVKLQVSSISILQCQEYMGQHKAMFTKELCGTQ